MINNNNNIVYPSMSIQHSQALDYNYYSQLSTQCFYPNEIIEEPIQSQLQNKDSLIEKLDLFFIMLTDIFLSNKKLIISIVDLDKSAIFNYDEGCYILPEETKNYKYSILTLFGHSTKIAQIIKLASLLYMKSITFSGSTKRELYYNDVELFKSTICIDTIISDMCSLLFINRFQMSVFPSAKGLFAGNITIINKDSNVSIQTTMSFSKINLIASDYFTNDYIVKSSADFILIVEKETLFFNLINNKEYHSILGKSIIITGKGYPDYLTKYFIKKLNNMLPSIPILYFGDYDPYGFEIYLNYLFGSKHSSRENDFMTVNNIKWVGLRWDMIFRLKQNENHDSLIRLSNRDITKIKHLLVKEYFNMNHWALSINPFRDAIVESLVILYDELNNMLVHNYKAEGEYLLSRHINDFINYLCININKHS